MRLGDACAANPEIGADGSVYQRANIRARAERTGVAPPTVPRLAHYSNSTLGKSGLSTQCAVRVLALVLAFGRGRIFDPIGAAEFRHPSTRRSGQLTLNSDTHQPVGRSNWPWYGLPKPRCNPRPSSSRRSSRLRDHLTKEVERFAPSRRPGPRVRRTRRLSSSMTRWCSVGSTGSPEASSLGGKTLRHRRAISSSDHCSAMSGRLRSTR